VLLKIVLEYVPSQGGDNYLGLTTLKGISRVCCALAVQLTHYRLASTRKKRLKSPLFNVSKLIGQIRQLVNWYKY